MKTVQKTNEVAAWTITLSVLVAIASLLGLFAPSIYGQETANWALQAKGQDIGNLLAAAVLIVSGYRYCKRSYISALVWLGSLLYLVYAYTIYAMAIHLNGLFLVYVAILGLSAYALLFNMNALRSGFGHSPDISARKFAGYTLAILGILFGLMWLGQLVPALIAGKVPQSILDAGLMTNPVHVIDLSVVLPGFILTGYLTVKNKPNGLFFVGPWLIFSVLMAVSIVAAMGFIGIEQGFAKSLPPLVILSVVAVVSSIAAWRYLRQTALGVIPPNPAGQ